MAKIAAKFEDWTPPWGDGEIDEDKTARLIYNLQVSEQEKTAELRTVKSANTELTSANEVLVAASEASKSEQSTEVQKAVASAEKERDQAVKRADEAEKTNWKLQAQVKFPALEDADFKRISGDDLEAFLEDAEEFAEIKAPKVSEEENEQEQEDADDGIELRREPRVKRTPGDPEKNSRERGSAQEEKVVLENWNNRGLGW